MVDTPVQHDLFAEDPPRSDTDEIVDFEKPLPRYEPFRHTPDSVRKLLVGMTDELRACDTLPWDANTLRSNRAMAPYMAGWFKDGEGERLLAEFRAELVRLGEEPIHRKELYPDG